MVAGASAARLAVVLRREEMVVRRGEGDDGIADDGGRWGRKITLRNYKEQEKNLSV